MANIPTSGITIDNLPSASGVNDGDALVISRDGKTYKSTAIAEQVNELNADLTDIVGAKYFTSLDDLVAFADSLERYQIALVFISNTLMETFVGSSGVSKGMLTKSQTASGTFDFMFWYTNGQYIYTGRYNNGTITTYRYNGTNISTTSVGDPVVMGED